MMRTTGVLLLFVTACGGGGDATAGGSSSAGMTTGGETGETGGPTTGAEGGGSTATGSAADTTVATATATTVAGTTMGGGDATDDPVGMSTGGGSTTEVDTTTTGGGGDDLYDPNVDGPWQVAEVEGTIKVGQVDVAIDCFYPTSGPGVGPYPVVVVAHGFQLPAAQYVGYVKRLASHGYVALTADFKAELFATDHVANTKQVLAGIDWAAAEPKLVGMADTNNVGLTGHSLGGKLAVAGAVMDARVRASLTLDPVDGSQMCDAQKCPDVTDMLPIDIPLGFVGETLDGEGGFMPCAPKADNFLTFFAKASAPALAVTVKGANHMSFLDDVDTCGFTCGFCKAPTLANDVVHGLAQSYVVAFYGVHLKGEAGYEDYLTGATAQARYVETGLAELATK